MNSAVERAIKCIWERYSEPLSLTDVAKSAILSRFHFSRIFRDATGVSPGRYLSAVRIHQAKRMLLTTSMNITDISFAVGYSSLGSFTNHFTDSVGVSPGRFRRISRNGGFEPPDPDPDSSPLHGMVAGTVSLPDGYAGARLYLGIFDTPILQRQPVSAAVIEGPEGGTPYPYRLVNVPEGTWYIHVVAVADSTDPEPWTRRSVLIGGLGPMPVTAGTGTFAEVCLRVRRPTDLPILLALPDLEVPVDRVTPRQPQPIPVADLTSPPVS